MIFKARINAWRARLQRILEGSPRRKYSIIAGISLLLPLGLMLWTETLQRGSLISAFEWMLKNATISMFNYGIYLSVFVLIYALVGRFIFAAGLSALLLALAALTSYFKASLIGEPFFPWDLMLRKEGLNIFPYISSFSAAFKLLAILLCIVCIFLLRIVVPKLSLPLLVRLGLGLLSIYVLYAAGVQSPWAGKLAKELGYKETVWNQNKNYADNGLAAAFVMNIKHTIIERPEGYSKEELARIADSIVAIQQASAQSASGKQDNSTLSGQAAVKPNVIFIMNEAFWDPTLLPNVSFSEDPIPIVRGLQQQFTSGYLLSPQFGGGTSNVEFEVLTGLSMSLLPQGAVPYQQHVGDSLPTLASYFEDQGYYSMGIHPYDGWFWSRNRVYKSFGFERFKSKTGFDNPQFKGAYISDEEVTKSIIEEVSASERPMFIYAVTMQNHGPYSKPRYQEHEVQVSGELTEDAAQILQTYTQGVRDADKALGDLIAHFEQSGEPTVIIFYGDHLPMLGEEYSVYLQGGLISSSSAWEWSLEEWQRMRSMPFVTWSNIPMEKQSYPALSNAFLGSVILDGLHMAKPAQFALGSKLAKQLPAMTGPLYVDAQSQLYAKVPEHSKLLVDDYRKVQYDLMFGKRYLADYVDSAFIRKAPLEGYTLE